MTETAHQAASNPLPADGPGKDASVGLPTGLQVRIVTSTGNLAAAGETGEVCVRGPAVADGYLGDPQATAAAFTGGWFRTGDLGYLDSDGYLFLSGRTRDMINRGGEKIAPREVDDVLLQHPAVAEAVAFGSPHPSWGEEVAAAVVLKGAATEKELIAFARERLADHKVPKKLYLVEQIPRTATGKIQRRAVAEVFNNR
jgi:oxalate---CoA ligase